MSRTTLILMLTLAATPACDGGEEGRAARTYAANLEPLLQENGLLADVVLTEAARVYNGAARSEDLAATWTRDVVPLAEHLHHQAASTRAPEAWTARHDELTRTWGERSDAYRDIERALRTGDQKLWEAARKRSDDAKLREEKWFREVNADLSAWRVELDQFP